jgi:hypothetical protein
MVRRRSLNKDHNDFKQFRYGRDRHVGFSVSNEYYQHVPFFYTRENASVNILGNYRGASLFIVCNGPSLASGNFDLSLLKRPGIMTYGMNNGARTIRPNFWSCVDDPKRFLKSIWLDPTITKFVPHAHAEKPIFDNEKWQDTNQLVGQCPNVIYYHRNEKFMADRFLFEDTINWGNSGDNGGGRSVFLPVLRIAFLLGFRKIYLLGADFKMSENYTYHFDEQRSKGAVNGNNNTYDRLKDQYLPELKPYLEAEGVEIYNCNPDSNLKVFDFMDYREAIRRASSDLGDVDNERTWGMYSKPEERQNWKQEPDVSAKSHLLNINVSAPVYNAIPVESVLPKEEIQIVPPKPTPPPPRLIKEGSDKPLPPHSLPQMIPETRFIKDSPKKNESESRRIIRPLPCGDISVGSSRNITRNITIEDDGN